MVAENSLTVGALSAFLLYAAYVGVAIGGLSSFYSEMMKGLGASTRLWELIDTTPSIPLQGAHHFSLLIPMSNSSLKWFHQSLTCIL